MKYFVLAAIIAVVMIARANEFSIKVDNHSRAINYLMDTNEVKYKTLVRIAKYKKLGVIK
jgi:hypothetical protein